MKTTLVFVICLFLAACASNSGVGEPKRDASKPLNHQEKAYVAQAEADGRLMYEKDIRAAHASDLLLNKVSPTDYPNFVGWVTYPNAEDYTVSFYERVGDRFTVIADVIYEESGEEKIDLAPDRDLSENEISMIKARISALESGVNSCSDRFNTVVLPAKDSEMWDVYVLAATTDPDVMQVGGHAKITVSKATSEVLGTVPLSKSCLALDKSGKDLPEGASVQAMTVSHIVSPMPVAIHPYLNLLHGINLAVITERGIWMVADGEMELL